MIAYNRAVHCIFFSAMTDGVVRGKIPTGRAGIWWGNAVETIWKDLDRNHEDILYIEKFGGYKTEAKETVEVRERLPPRKQRE